MSSDIFRRDVLFCAECGVLRTDAERDSIAGGLCCGCAELPGELAALAAGRPVWHGVPLPDGCDRAGEEPENRDCETGVGAGMGTTSPARVLPPSPLPRVRLREDDVVSGIYLACALLGVLAAIVWWWLA